MKSQLSEDPSSYRTFTVDQETQTPLLDYRDHLRLANKILKITSKGKASENLGSQERQRNEIYDGPQFQVL